MKSVLAVLVVLLLAATAVQAGGDKVRGDKGQGAVNQVVGPP